MLIKVLSPESELVLQLSQGSEQAFEKIYHAYSARLYGNLIKLAKSESVAAELLQDVFVKIWEVREHLDPEKSFRSYLFRIAENKVYDYFRKAARENKVNRELLKGSTEAYSHIEEDIDTRESVTGLYDAIDSLPPQRQQIFRLCKLDGKSYKQVSSMLSVSTSTISDHIVKANQHIRSYMSCRV